METHADRIWYPYVVGLLALIDSIVVVIPTDGILVSSVFLAPRKWFLFGLCVAVGSTIGGLLVAQLVAVKGLPWILEYYPGINETKTWLLTETFFEKYGLFLVFTVALTPFMQQPAVILASLAKVPIVELGLAMFVGRLIKYALISYLASHAPKFLKGRWGFPAD